MGPGCTRDTIAKIRDDRFFLFASSARKLANLHWLPHLDPELKSEEITNDFGTSRKYISDMIKFIIPLFVLFVASVTFAKQVDSLEKLRDVSMLMRIPEQVCKGTGDLGTELTAAGHSAYDSALTELKQDLEKSSKPEKFILKSKTCLKDCTCQIYEDIGDLFTKSQKKIYESVKSLSAAMTDKDYEKCQKKIHLKCSSKNIESVIAEAKKAKAESATGN
jgi:hypothetical protein